MKKIFILLFMFALFASPALSAIEPPYKEIEYCYRIENINSYPDFVIIARYPNANPDSFQSRFVQLKSDECFSRSNRDEIVAVRSDRFLASGIGALDSFEQWKEIDYFDTNEDVLHSGVEVPVAPIKVYDLNDPRKKIEDVFTIEALGGQKFSVRFTKRIIQNEDGAVQERAYATTEEGLADTIASGYEYGFVSSTESVNELSASPTKPIQETTFFMSREVSIGLIAAFLSVVTLCFFLIVDIKRWRNIGVYIGIAFFIFFWVLAKLIK